MSPTRLRIALAAAFLLVAAAALVAVRGHEATLAHGRVVLARLAPVDPRSLMQGDYMALRFAIDNELPHPGDEAALPAYAYLALDGEGRARLAGTGEVLPADPALVAVRIRRRDGAPTIGPNAFFFREGRAEAYAAAQWGEFRVATDGKSLLTHLRDDALRRLGEIER